MIPLAMSEISSSVCAIFSPSNSVPIYSHRSTHLVVIAQNEEYVHELLTDLAGQ